MIRYHASHLAGNILDFKTPKNQPGLSDKAIRRTTPVRFPGWASGGGLLNFDKRSPPVLAERFAKGCEHVSGYPARPESVVAARSEMDLPQPCTMAGSGQKEAACIEANRSGRGIISGITFAFSTVTTVISN